MKMPEEESSKFHKELALETNAVIARLRGDPAFVFGVDNARVSRVIEAMQEADEGG